MKRGWENLLHGVVAGLVLPAVASVYPQTAAAYDRTGELMNRMQEMQEEMRALQQELQDMKAGEGAQELHMQQMHADDDAKHKQVEDRMTAIETAPPKRSHKNLVFFRGGYAAYPNEGRGFESFTESHATIVGSNPVLASLFGLASAENDGNDQGWYVGAAIEHSLSDDLWGLWRGTEALGEISLEWKRFGSESATVVVPTAECALIAQALGQVGGTTGSILGVPGAGSCVVTGNDTITMFTVSAAPKIKFMEGSKLRPWIIPAGLDFHVISPPSDAATVLDVGVQFAAGVEYEIIPGIKFGIDGRYHLTANETNTGNNFTQVLNNQLAASVLGPGVQISGSTEHDNDFWTIGGYLGFSF
ncbi:MAG: hypothetical protein ACREU9_09215 [Gammaproteobacteria bacterium]